LPRRDAVPDFTVSFDHPGLRRYMASFELPAMNKSAIERGNLKLSNVFHP